MWFNVSIFFVFEESIADGRTDGSTHRQMDRPFYRDARTLQPLQSDRDSRYGYSGRMIWVLVNHFVVWVCIIIESPPNYAQFVLEVSCLFMDFILCVHA